MRVNWCGLISALLMLASLLLPWLSATFYQLVGTLPTVKPDYSLHAGLSINYFGIIGSANGVTKTLFFPYWFNWLFSALLIAAGLIALKGSFATRTAGRRLMTFAAIFAIICSPLFYFAFTSRLFSMPITSNNMLFAFFGPSDFGLDNTYLNSFHSKIDNLSFYWLPVAAGILAILSRKFFKD